jgi:hypothetical protein
MSEYALCEIEMMGKSKQNHPFCKKTELELN